MDSLRYWVNEMHVDGFRFDLASALARQFYDVDRLSAFFDIIHQDPVLSRVKLVAEPWDVGDGGYQVGNFPVRWAEWNGAFRDTVRDFWRGADRHPRPRATVSPGRATSTRATAANRPRASTSSPRTTASRSPISSRTTRSTTEPTARTTRTATTTTARGTAASRVTPTTRRSSSCARANAATSSPRCCSPKAARCCSAATRSDAPSTATTTRTARTMRSPGSTGSASTRRCSRSSHASSRCGAATRCCAAATSSPARPIHGSGRKDIAWFLPSGREVRDPNGSTSGSARSG